MIYELSRLAKHPALGKGAATQCFKGSCQDKGDPLEDKITGFRYADGNVIGR